jgi:uncharacterized surface protein with fasciclin (FAS1) repeats
MQQVHQLTNSFRVLAVVTCLAIGVSSAVFAGGHKKAAPPAASADIVDVAVSAGSFTTLVAALQAADLVGALQGDGPFTVFAPTDAAFAALPDGTVDSLLKPENKEQLQAVLLYHVVPGQVMSVDLSGTVNAETLQGATVEIVASSSGVTVNGANVVSADVVASNGVIHVVDAVLLPPAE